MIASPFLDILRTIRDAGGFLTPSDLATIVHHDRLRLVLLRFHHGRCLAPAQDVDEFIRLLEAGGGCLRDVSLPTSDPIYQDAKGRKVPQ